MFTILSRSPKVGFSTLSRMIKIRPPAVLTPVTLEGRHINLEPLSMSHLPALLEAGADPEVWKWTTSTCNTPELMKAYIQTAISWREAGIALPFAHVEKSTGRVIGSTRFAAFNGVDRRSEIGWTWLTPSKQRTPCNTEAKYLMLRYAFEDLELLRVEFKTDSLNNKSRSAMERIGLKFEGIFRNHMVMDNGRIRDSAYYSIIDTEWPEVKKNLEDKLARPFTQ